MKAIIEPFRIKVVEPNREAHANGAEAVHGSCTLSLTFAALCRFSVSPRWI